MFGYPHSLRALVIMVLTCASACHRAAAGRYVAFSLRQAAQQAQTGPKSTDLLTLAGITRVVGMVHAPEGDIILVGRVIEGLPGARLDDLVVALRARVVRDETPTVSIDPTAETPVTGLQRIRFLGGIERTQFGKDLEDCDVYLKRYSLSLIPTIREIQSYRALVESELATRLQADGVRIGATEWLKETDRAASVQGLEGRSIKAEASRHTRFWFTPLGRPRLWLRDGVACIRELRLCVQQEVIGEAAANGTPESATASGKTAGELFAQQFTEHLREATTAQPLLQRLKVLFDLTAVAELVRHLENPPDLSFFLKEYPVPVVPTSETHELIRIAGIARRSDGLQHALEISGGIEFKMDIEWLSRGDCSFLRGIVLKTRPSPTSLAWTLPLETWRMLNSRDLDRPENNEASLFRPAVPQDPGCSVFVQSFALEPPGAGRTGGLGAFRGFSPPPAACLNGVSMRIEISNELFEQDSSGELAQKRERIMENRPDNESLFWSVKGKGQSK